MTKKKRKPHAKTKAKKTAKTKKKIQKASKQSRKRATKRHLKKHKQRKGKSKLVSKTAKKNKSLRKQRRKSVKAIKRSPKKRKYKRRVTKQKIQVRRLKERDKYGNETSFLGNVLELSFTATDFDEKIQQVNEWNGREIDFYIEKYSDRFPRAFIIIIETDNEGNTFDRSNTMSPPDMAVTIDNIKEQIINALNLFYTDFFIRTADAGELLDGDYSWALDPDFIARVFIRFIYKED